MLPGAALQRCSSEKVFWKYATNYTKTWVLSCKFAACFQNTLSYEHLWGAASVLKSLKCFNTQDIFMLYPNFFT